MKYQKIPTVFKRDPETKFRTLLPGVYATETLEYLSGLPWEWTEKVDGTNIRVIWNPQTKVREFRGRTDRAEIPPFLLERLDDLFVSADLARTFVDEQVVLYGEGYGAKIQSGGGYMPDGTGCDFCLFDVRVGSWWLKPQSVSELARNFSVERAPILGAGTLQELVSEGKKGFESWIPGARRLAEGIVARPLVELVDRRGDRVITKIKHKDFK